MNLAQKSSDYIFQIDVQTKMVASASDQKVPIIFPLFQPSQLLECLVIGHRKPRGVQL